MAKNPELHKGHRQRILKKYLENGIQSLEEHEILEVLLFFAFSRCNTNDISHKLINRFGSITQVFEAPIEDLVKIDGIGDAAATLLHFMGDFIRVMGLTEVPAVKLDNLNSILLFCNNRLPNDGRESCHFLLLDKRGYFITCVSMTIGEFSLVNIDFRHLILKALNANAGSIVIVHNHPETDVIAASTSDVSYTRKLSDLLLSVGINIVDHIIFGKNGYLSMRRAGLLDDIWS